MRLPEWFPQAPRPWNPAFAEVWEDMTPNERRWSLFIDLTVAVLVLGFAVYCFGPLDAALKGEQAPTKP